MGRFKDGNHPGNGRGKQGKGNFETTGDGDHILGTKGDDNGSSAGATSIDADGYTNLIDLKGGDDLFNGFAGDDKVYGGAGNDNLNGGEGDDTLAGGADDDVIEGGAGADIIDGGEGNDTASYSDASGPVTVDLSLATAQGDLVGDSDEDGDVLVSIENLVGSDHDDVLTGDDNANVIHGGDGDDTIDGGAGDDTIVGGNGDDDLTGGAGADTFVYDSAGEGGDTITDFDTTNPALDDGDLIDVSSALSGFTGTDLQDAVDDGFLTFVDDGNGDVLVQIDADGGGDNFVDLAALEGVAFTDEATAITALEDNFLL